MINKFGLFIFDFDGTLVDTIDDIAYYANTVLADLGERARPINEVKQAVGWGVRELFLGLDPKLRSDAGRLEEAVRLFRSRYLENPVRVTRAYPQVHEMLQGPLSKTPKTIITNKPQDITEKILDLLGLKKYFTHVIGLNSIYPLKPDPTSTISMLKKYEMPASKALFVGDSAVDYETAKNAAVEFLWMDYGYDRSLAANDSIRRSSSAADWAAYC